LVDLKSTRLQIRSPQAPIKIERALIATASPAVADVTRTPLISVATTLQLTNNVTLQVEIGQMVRAVFAARYLDGNQRKADSVPATPT
jgi:hypothetical protein